MAAAGVCSRHRIVERAGEFLAIDRVHRAPGTFDTEAGDVRGRPPAGRLGESRAASRRGHLDGVAALGPLDDIDAGGVQAEDFGHVDGELGDGRRETVRRDLDLATEGHGGTPLTHRDDPVRGPDDGAVDHVDPE